MLILLHLLSESRTGRAWKASREDPLAAEMMGTPVNRLKIMAFSLGAMIAGLAGTTFAASQTGAFPQNFSTQVLILIYAVVILGGAGSLTGMLVGATVIIVLNQVLDSTSPPNLQRGLFYLVLIIGFAWHVPLVLEEAGHSGRTDASGSALRHTRSRPRSGHEASTAPSRPAGT